MTDHIVNLYASICSRDVKLKKFHQLEEMMKLIRCQDETDQIGWKSRITCNMQ